MDAQTDAQLVRTYAERRSDAAFAELVRRHIDLVHSAARRMVCDAHLAEDVTQATFVALAKNAVQLTDRKVLAGWLHRTAQNIAAQTVRTDVRRRAREQEAAAMNELLATTSEAAWEQIAPHLDAALGELGESERDAVLLRYFQRQSAREMAQTLGISDEAAQKRVSRAVERLREFFAKRGVTVGASGLAVVISANAVQAAPVGLALTISTAAVLTGTTVATTGTVAASKAVAMTALQKTIVTATIAVLAGAGIYEARQAAQLREQVQTLQQQQAPLAELDNLRKENKQLATLNVDADELLRLRGEHSELLRLRGEIGQLRRQGIERNQRQTASTAATAKASLAPTTKAEFETANRQMSFAMSRVDNALRQFVTNNPYGVLVDANGQPNPDLFANFPGLPLDNIEINARDVQILANALDQKSRLILAASKNPIFFNGMWTHFYLTADGSVRSETNYKDTPRQHIFPSDEDLAAMRDSQESLPENLRKISTTIAPVVNAFSAANDGKEFADPAQLAPYATTPEQQAALQQLLQMKQNASSYKTGR